MIASQDGMLDESVQRLLAVTRRADLEDDPELAGPLTSSLAIVCAYAGSAPEAIEWARRTLSEPTPSPAVALTARQGLALGLAQCGRERDAIEALASPSLSQPNPPPFDVELVITRGAIKAQAGDLRGAVDDLTAVIGWSRAGVASRGLPNAYASLAEAEYRLGRWQHGAAHAELAVSLARDSDQVWSCRSPTRPRACSTPAAASGQGPSSTRRTRPRPHSSRRCRWRCSPPGWPPRIWHSPAVSRAGAGAAGGALGRAARGRRPGAPAADLRARGRGPAAGGALDRGGRAAGSVRAGRPPGGG